MNLNKFKKNIILFTSIILVSYLFIGYFINNNKLEKVKNLINEDLRYLVKKYVFVEMPKQIAKHR